MGNSLSSWGGVKKVQAIINKSGLPLSIDTENPHEDNKVPLSTFTEAYDAPGWFTGVKSAVSIARPAAVVYESLSKDLHKVFTPMSECVDEIEEEDGEGGQVIFRIVRIPFKVAFVTGNLKLRLNVEQSSRTRQIRFESAKEGRLITRFIADFDIRSSEDNPEKTIVSLDAKVNAKSLPPPPFRAMVKDVMVRKMDSCMVDLLQFHSEKKPEPIGEASKDEQLVRQSPFENAAPVQKSTEQAKRLGFMDMVRSLSAPLRASLDYFDRRRSVEFSNKKSERLQETEEEERNLSIDDGEEFHDATSQLVEDTDLEPFADDLQKAKPSSSAAQGSSDANKSDLSNSETQIIQGQASMFKEWQKGML